MNMRRNAQWIGQGYGPQVWIRESTVTAGVNDLRDKLQEAQTALAQNGQPGKQPGGDTGRSEKALAQIEAARNRLQQAARPQQNGQQPGNGRNGNRGPPAETDSQGQQAGRQPGGQQPGQSEQAQNGNGQAAGRSATGRPARVVNKADSRRGGQQGGQPGSKPAEVSSRWIRRTEWRRVEWRSLGPQRRPWPGAALQRLGADRPRLSRIAARSEWAARLHARTIRISPPII